MNTLPKHDWQQNRPSPQNQGLNRPMAWIGVMLLAMLVAVGLARWSGLDPRTPDAAVQWQRDLQFRDLPGGDIAVLTTAPVNRWRASRASRDFYAAACAPWPVNATAKA